MTYSVLKVPLNPNQPTNQPYHFHIVLLLVPCCFMVIFSYGCIFYCDITFRSYPVWQSFVTCGCLTFQRKR